MGRRVQTVALGWVASSIVMGAVVSLVMVAGILVLKVTGNQQTAAWVGDLALVALAAVPSLGLARFLDREFRRVLLLPN
jgi:hypothetical protein